MGEESMISKWRKAKPRDKGKFEIGCMNQSAHRKVPFLYQVKKGAPTRCPECGRNNGTSGLS